MGLGKEKVSVASMLAASGHGSAIGSHMYTGHGRRRRGFITELPVSRNTLASTITNMAVQHNTTARA